MIHSMTAFAGSAAQGPWGSATCELRSVNHRYLDLSLRLPERLFLPDMPFRDCLRRHIARGKVECIFHYQPPAQAAALTLNLPLADALLAAAETLVCRMPSATPPSPLDILAWPGVFQQAGSDVEKQTLQEGFLVLLTNTLEQFSAARAREGKTLQGIFLEKLSGTEKALAVVRDRLPIVQAEQNERLRKRFLEAGISPGEDRIAQEIVLLAQKMDIAEETDRLHSHIAELRRLLETGGTVGQRLDFLMQEMGREANTMGSKSADILLSHAVIELRVLIGQMREQVQNIE